MTQITAQDIRQQLKAREVCTGLDEWITETLTPRFLTTGRTCVTIDQRMTKNWIREHFEKAMVLRGFKVDYTCDSRPGEYPYYEISI